MDGAIDTDAERDRAEGRGRDADRDHKLTRERVRQIKDKAIRRLKSTSKSKLLKSYLG